MILATLATIIASQAIITGAFSLTRQAMQLGWFPGVHIHQTSADQYGQIYVPFVNWTMMAATLALTYGFGSSERLAGAYGTAVSTTMLLTTALLYNAMRDSWRWPMPVALLIAAIFLSVDGAFFAANLLKLPDGGWIALLFGLAVFTIMTTWHRGMRAVAARLAESAEHPDAFFAELRSGRIARVPGTAVFLTRTIRRIPPLLVNHVAQFKALQETVVTLTVVFEETPRVAEADRAEVQHLERWHLPCDRALRLHRGAEPGHGVEAGQGARLSDQPGRRRADHRARPGGAQRAAVPARALAAPAVRFHVPQRRALRRSLRPAGGKIPGDRAADQTMTRQDGRPAYAGCITPGGCRRRR